MSLNDQLRRMVHRSGERPQPLDGTCEGKLMWGSYSSAMGFLRQSYRRFKNKARVYKCDVCGWWHLSTLFEGNKKR